MSNEARSGTFVDLFAGCGGLSLGLEQAGFQPLLVNELSPEAMETYLLNRDSRFPLLREKYHVSDVKELVENDGAVLDEISERFANDYGVDVRCGELDLVVGGPPCQGYSVINHRRSYPIERRSLPANHLFQDMALVVEKLRPRLFLFENVKGLLSARWTTNGRNGEIWEEVLGRFQAIPGYRVRHTLVLAQDYGVPQNRPRVLIIGVRDDITVTLDDSLPAGGLLPGPVRRAPEIEELLSDLIDPGYEPGGTTSTYPGGPANSLQEELRRDPWTQEPRAAGDRLTEHEYSSHSPRIVERFRFMIENAGALPPGHYTKKYAQRVLPPTWDQRGPRITATSLPDDFVHYAQPRTLTVREWARLQTFPDWYQFAGPRTVGGLRRAGNPQLGIHHRVLPKYTQIGNAVPVALARAIAEHIANILANNESARSPFDDLYR